MERLHAGEVPGWDFFFLLHVARDVQGAAGQPQKRTWGPRGSHSRLVGDSQESGAQRVLGVSGPPPGVCAKIKN